MRVVGALVLVAIAVSESYGLPARKDQHVIGGEVSGKGQWPWMLSLQRKRDTGFAHSCGAALLTPGWILTAAHCLDPTQDPSTYYRVLAGSFNHTADDFEDLVALKSIIIHEGYDDNNPDGILNDVAVAELERPIGLANSNIGLVKLPRHGDVFSGNEHAFVTGWGRFDPDLDDGSPVLKQMHVPVWTKEECIQLWNDFRPTTGKFIYDQHVCVAGPDTGVCHGDSGSPLNVDMTGHGDWVVAGVASFASGSRCIGATGVYAGVEYFLDWVESKVPGLPGNKN